MFREGLKYDTNKPRFDLLPPRATLEVVHVLTHGANKYDDHNWKKVDNLDSRYLAAAGRHLNSYMLGESRDQESGRHHLAHAICCLMFILEDYETHKTAVVPTVLSATPSQA